MSSKKILTHSLNPDENPAELQPARGKIEQFMLNLLGSWNHNKPQLFKDAPILDPVTPQLSYVTGQTSAEESMAAIVGARIKGPNIPKFTGAKGPMVGRFRNGTMHGPSVPRFAEANAAGTAAESFARPVTEIPSVPFSLRVRNAGIDAKTAISNAKNAVKGSIGRTSEKVKDAYNFYKPQDALEKTFVYGLGGAGALGLGASSYLLYDDIEEDNTSNSKTSQKTATKVEQKVAPKTEQKVTTKTEQKIAVNGNNSKTAVPKTTEVTKKPGAVSYKDYMSPESEEPIGKKPGAVSYKDYMSPESEEPIGKKPVQSVPLTLGQPTVPGTPTPKPNVVLTPEQRREGLIAAFAPRSTTPLKSFDNQGRSGDDVKRIQQSLIDAGFGELLGKGGKDGKWGQDTQAAIDAYRQKEAEKSQNIKAIPHISKILPNSAQIQKEKLAQKWLPGDYKKKGGNIEIKPENKGKFTATKKATGKTTEELTHSKNPVTRKRAIFAKNAKKWKHKEGGKIDFDLTNILSIWKK